ncbi:MAG: trypsin-like serine protease [Kaiparowitsia implicata GSE-PSE-MK54-09C]|jgi:protease YdgD|nr:trypsin-like serine protease [Kaiparowitsia implicata GSE-PSE-MK54-09C]
MNRFLTLGMASVGFALAAVPLTQASLSWQAQATEQTTAETQLPSLTNLSELEFDIEASRSFIPEGLSQSDNPSEGGRVIIGPDNRQPVYSKAYPWSAMGQIVGFMSNGSGYTCTGTLVTDNIVLTNAHCVVNPRTRQHSQRIEFHPNLVNGLVTHEDDVAEVTGWLLGTDFVGWNPDEPSPDDWALVRLDKPLGQTYGTIGFSPLPS